MLLSVSSHIAVAGPGVERTYVLSDDAGDEIFSIQWLSVVPRTHRFRLYGDGRLIGTDEGLYAVDEPVELRLSPDEVRAIIDIVVDAGLIDPSDTPKQPPEHTTTEVSALWLRLSLASFESPRRTAAAPFVYSIAMHAPQTRARWYREDKAAGRISASEPETLVEAEALLHLWDYLERRVFDKEGR